MILTVCQYRFLGVCDASNYSRDWKFFPCKFVIPAKETVLQSFFVIASDRRERGNLYVFGNL